MNKKMISVLFISFSAIIVLVSNINYPYKENILYNQSQLKEYNERVTENNSTNLINRSKAIEISSNILGNILGVDLKAGNPQMYVDVYRNSRSSDVYDWNIWWSRDDYSGNYGVEMQSNNGEILHVYVNENMPIKNTNVSSELSKEDILDIIKPFTDSLQIEIDNYKMDVKSKVEYNVVGVKTPYKYCTFSNKNNDKFRIIIDSRAEAIVSYMKNPSKED